MEWLLLAGLGLLSGSLSTVTGVGGGALAVAVLSAILGPHQALAVTAPALLVGNTHRIWLFRRALRDIPPDLRAKVRSFLLGAAPAALVASLLVASFPQWVVGLLIVTASTLFVLKKTLGNRLELRSKFLSGFGVAAGAVTATSGGGGVIVAPVMLATGLKGGGYIVACSLAAVSIHTMRLPGYFLGGLLDAGAIVQGISLAGGLAVGNLVGREARSVVGEKLTARLTVLVLFALVLMALAGFLLSL